MAEKGNMLNNAQMASAPGISMWVRAAEEMVKRAAAGQTWPLDATGEIL